VSRVHELALCRSIVDVVDRARDGRRVRTVNLQVGMLRQVVPDTLVHCWGLVCAEGPLEGSRLVVDYVPVLLECRDCGARTTLGEALLLQCEECGSGAVELRGGEELVVTSVDLVKEH
jgi:hydrogenase nickel incorporation protein HypA/HybF